jgi:YebC/PmpR family DNA-binding regulatory protein
MGRIFEKRKERMFARWTKNARAFTKLGKELSIAIRLGGSDPAGNPRLRLAIQTARSLNMPKDRIDAAIKRATSKDCENLEELSYEGYAPHGVACFIDAATDNPTRTVANIRSVLSRWGGTLATTGALSFVFSRKGIFTIDIPKEPLDEVELYLIDFGLEECVAIEDGVLIYCDFKDFGAMQKAIETRNYNIQNASLQRIPSTFVELTEEQEEEVEKLISALEEDDDVQHVYHNYR